MRLSLFEQLLELRQPGQRALEAIAIGLGFFELRLKFLQLA